MRETTIQQNATKDMGIAKELWNIHTAKMEKLTIGKEKSS